MNVNYYNIKKEFKRIENAAIKTFKNIGLTGNYILGNNLKKFEKRISQLLKCRYVVGVANGTDALEIALATENIKKGTEIITTSNTFISTVNAIINYGCTPVFVDIDETLNIDPSKIEEAITKKTSAIIPVHLNGMPSCLNKINKIANKFKLKVVEDSAQSILSKYNKRYIGNSDNLSCFSLHPTKNLGGIGDGGFITTNNKIKFKKILLLRNHGLAKRGEVKIPGRNSRLDEINAGILNLKLNYLVNDIKRKIKISKLYDKYLTNKIDKPNYGCCKGITHTFHRYVIRVKRRKEFLNFLKKNKIEAKIHYEKNIHKQNKFKLYLKNKKRLLVTDTLSNKIVSLPINQFLSDSQIKFVIKKINYFYK
jgi:UDP-2-acetamido-2-deoxy-ribo-hexuluronate aminotransferase